jgi:hypothetical protein
VPPLTIVEDLDVVEDILPGLSVGLPMGPVGELALRVEKKLSIGALSQQLPRRLILHSMLCLACSDR